MKLSKLTRLTLLPALAASAALAFSGCEEETETSDEPADGDAATTAPAPAAEPKTDAPAAATDTATPEPVAVEKPAGGGKPVAVTGDNFDAVVLKSDKVVLVDYWATWCGPCKMIAPSIDQIAKDYDGRVVVAKLDVDVAGPTAKKYGVQVLPTLMVFKDGKVVDTVPQDRLPTRDDIASVLDKHL